MERLRGKIGDLASLNLPDIILCPPILCNPAFAESVQISESGVEQPTVVTETPVEGAGGEQGEDPTETPTQFALSELTVMLNANARCRKGPDTRYEDHAFFSEGDEGLVTGRNTDGSWLVINAPNNLGTCWIGRGVLDIDVSDEALMTLSEVIPPPLPTETSAPPSDVTTAPSGGSGSAPAAPANASWDGQVCTGSSYSVNISWSDAADNETGYRILRNGAEIALLSANSKSYTDNPPYGGPYTYTIEAYNNNGSAKATVQDPGCLP
jgi:hypothetical protein